MGGIKNAFAVGQSPKRTHYDQFRFTVSARHGVAEFHVCPYAIIVHSHDVLDEPHLPFESRPARSVVKLRTLTAEGIGVGKNAADGGGLPADSLLFHSDGSPVEGQRKFAVRDDVVGLRELGQVHELVGLLTITGHVREL